MEEEDGGLVARAAPSGGKVKLRARAGRDDAGPGPRRGRDRDGVGRCSCRSIRGPGGLQATRKPRGGKESSWAVLGASRGEAGILGEGIRQALLRDPTYGPALTAACEMLSR